MQKNLFLRIILLFSVFFAACNNNTRDNADVSGIQVNAGIKRFEKDLFSMAKLSPSDVVRLRSEYGRFFDLFVHQMIRIPENNDSLLAENLTLFVNDEEVKEVFHKSDSTFNNLGDIESKLEIFLKHHKYYFPQRELPLFVSYISVFNYAVMATDSVMGIGLDMFLGPEESFYPAIGIPKYLYSKFSRDYIVPSVIKGWFQSDYDPSSVKDEFLSQMIYQGKMLYYMKSMIPELEDTLVTGYTGQQLNWCRENEDMIWSFFIENKLLFNTDASEYGKFINEGPSTPGFPKESPGKAGAWIGWRIVDKYMKEQSAITLNQLLAEQDAQKILRESGYKPEK
jgi:gliding motility-associated lipoprotein GldB